VASDPNQTQVTQQVLAPVRLLLVQGPADLLGRRFALARSEVWIGRHEDCDVVIPDPRVSRVHAAIVSGESGPVLFHRSQTNATLLNGAPVKEPEALADGDTIALASGVVLRVEAPGRVRAEAPRGSMRHAMEARLQLDARIEQEFMRTGALFDLDVADSHGLSASDPHAERVVVSFERFRAFALRGIEASGGRFLNSNGDELMAFFPRPDDAVAAARAILAGLPEWNARENLLGRPFAVRIGIHHGRAAVDLASGVAYGPVVSRTGHLQKAAPIDGVRISDEAYRALTGDRGGFEPSGPAGGAVESWVLAR
jgi:class 3 adenylate cyclase